MPPELTSRHRYTDHRVAATIGHRMILAGAQPALGVAINLARTAIFLRGIGDIRAWLEQELYRLGVEVQLSTHMDTDDIVSEGAEDVLIAAGSLPRVDGFQLANPSRRVAGTHLPHVISSIGLLSDSGKPHGKTALVLGTMDHYELGPDRVPPRARTLRHLCHQLRKHDAVCAQHMARPAGAEAFLRLGDFDIRLRHELVEIRAADCIIHPLQAGANQTITVSADTVVLVTQNMPLLALHDDLRQRGIMSHLIGDALSPRDMQVAAAEGHRAAGALS